MRYGVVVGAWAGTAGLGTHMGLHPPGLLLWCGGDGITNQARLPVAKDDVIDPCGVPRRAAGLALKNPNDLRTNQRARGIEPQVLGHAGALLPRPRQGNGRLGEPVALRVALAGLADEGELSKELADQQRGLMNLRFRQATMQLNDTNELRRARVTIARIKTVIREREIAAELGLDSKAE